MKRFLLPVCALALAGLLTAAYAATYKIIIEGEKYKSITPSMAKTASGLASAGAYVQVPLKRPHGETEGAPTDQGKAVYRVKVPVAGRYQFWGLCHWHDGCGNSFFLKVDDKPAQVLGQDGTYQRWHWVPGPKWQLTAGTHTIVLQYREDGAKLDQFLLTNDLRFVPVRAMPATPQYIAP